MKNSGIDVVIFKDIRLDSIALPFELDILPIDDRVVQLTHEYGSLEYYNASFQQAPSSLVPFINLITTNVHFTRLVLNNVMEKLDSGDIVKIMLYLKFKSDVIKTLDLHNTVLVSKEMRYFMSLIHKEGIGIINLVLDGNHFPPPETSEMLMKFAINQRIQVLHLVHNNIRYDHYITLFSALKNNGTLSELHVIDDTLMSTIPSFI